MMADAGPFNHDDDGPPFHMQLWRIENISDRSVGDGGDIAVDTDDEESSEGGAKDYEKGTRRQGSRMSNVGRTVNSN